MEVKQARLCRTVLIADADKGIRDDLAWSLRVHGYRVLDAGTTVEALAALASHVVDLFVVGIGPRFDGRMALEKLSDDQRFATIPVLVITSRPELVPDRAVLNPSVTGAVFAGTVRSMIGPARIRPLTPIPGELLIGTLLDGASDNDDDVDGPDRGS